MGEQVNIKSKNLKCMGNKELAILHLNFHMCFRGDCLRKGFICVKQVMQNKLQ